ncbi:MAG TPA: MFS transporter, partial [Gammaproteobacteria bacterium]|nr:MFS transporter [Gammaproteobacteria bacterium]
MQFEHIKASLLERPMNFYQVLAVAIGVLVNMMDGYDLLAISFAAPGLQREWQLDDEQLGALFSAGLLGMAFGAFGLSWLSDVVGRRRGTMINLAVMTVGMSVAAMSRTYEVLFAARLLTGFGIGAMTASIGSLVFELASKRRREVSLGFVTAAFPVGTIIGGSISIWLLEVGWRAVFGFGAVLSALLIPLVFFRLPESLDYLIGRQPRGALQRANRELAKLGFEPLAALPVRQAAGTAQSESLLDVVMPPVVLSTILACLGYFGFMVSQYFILNWMPSLMVDIGYTDAGAISVALVMNLGAIFGCAVMGFLTAKWGVRFMTVLMLLVMSGSIAAFGTLPIDAVQLIRASSFFIGFASFATAVGIFSIMASGFPTHVRSTGIGFAFTAGRLGAAVGAYLGGFFLSLGLLRPQLCLVLAVPGVIAAVIVGILAKRNLGA